MDCGGNLRKCGVFDHSSVLDCVERQSEDAWRENEYRQNAYDVHSKTQSICLIYDEDFRHVEPTRAARFTDFAVALEPLIATIAGLFNYQGWVVRCILARLAGGATIKAHSDSGYSLLHAHRFHVPVITNEGVLFTVGGETVHMAAGEIWEINNKRRHSVMNLGADHRVHLILDWAEPMTHAEMAEYVSDREQHQRRIERGEQVKYD